MKNKITFVMALKDRPRHTLLWLSENIYDDFDYIIADGSRTNNNQKIFESLKLKNLKYYRFKKDLNYKDYYNKVYKAATKVKTEFVMQIDNDDFINPISIRKSLTFLSNNKHIQFLNGYHSSINKIKNKFYLQDFKEYNSAHLENNNKLLSIINLCKDYRILWYSIYRKKLFEQVWKKCCEFSTKHLNNNEILHGLLSLSYGRFKFYNTINYIRQNNQLNSSFKKIPKKTLAKSRAEIPDILDYVVKINNFSNKNKNLLKNIFFISYKYKTINSLILRIFLKILRNFSFSIKKIILINNLLIKFTRS